MIFYVKGLNKFNMIPLVFAITSIISFLGMLINPKSREGKVLLILFVVNLIFCITSSFYYFT